jgi:hypothetical protein
MLSANEEIGAVCINQSMLKPENQEALTRLLQQLNISPNGDPSPFGILFSRK